MNTQLSNLLASLGITANYTGYYYTLYAVELVTSDPSHLMYVTKDLYPAIAHRYGVTVSRVERNIRRMADLAWQTNPSLVRELAGYHLSRRPCASRFIAILAAQTKKLPNHRWAGVQQSLF